MKEYNLKTGSLYCGVDCMYDEEANKIDVYTNAYWTAETESEYNQKENLIFNWGYEDKYVKASAWCDISGFDYWVNSGKEDGNNYVSIDVSLKKPAEEYTQAEIGHISNLIAKWDDYFNIELN